MTQKRNALDQSSPSDWVDDHSDILYRYALRHVSDPEIAQDLVQETFLSAIKARDSFKGNSTLRTWLVSILRHKIIDKYRSDSRKPPISGDSLRPEETADQFEQLPNDQDNWKLDPENHLEQKKFLSTLQDCLEKLPEKLRSIFLMKEVEGMSRTEICNDFGISTTHVGVLLHRTREQLRRCLGKNWER